MPSAWDISPEMAMKIWRILVDVCGAYEDEDGREEAGFLMATTAIKRTGAREWRFCGKLGFGGKFWVNNSRWYVNCYRENETAEKVNIMERANNLLALLLREHLGQDPV